MPVGDSIPDLRPIPDFPGYAAVADGSIWTCKVRGGPRQWRLSDHWTQLKPTVSNKGYLRVMLNGPSGRRILAVHRLILLAFVGPCPEGMVCRHLNSVRTDNRLANLEWSTQADNLSDRAEAGTHIVGERNGHSKLTADQVREIREMFAAGVGGADIARSYGVHRNCIYAIVGRTRRQTWTHV